MKLTFLYQLLLRLKSETPKFFKLIIRWAIIIGAVGLALMGAKAQYGLEWIPQRLCEYMLVAGIVATTVSLTAAKNPPSEQ